MSILWLDTITFFVAGEGRSIESHSGSVTLGKHKTKAAYLYSKSGLVSTVCACANDSRDLLRMSPIMDKIHVVVMRRNNQSRYTACSVAAVFTRRWLPLSETKGMTRQGLRATTTTSSTVTVLAVETNGSLVADGLPKSCEYLQEYVVTIVDSFDHIQLLCFQHKISLPIQQRANLSAL